MTVARLVPTYYESEDFDITNGSNMLTNIDSNTYGTITCVDTYSGSRYITFNWRNDTNFNNYISGDKVISACEFKIKISVNNLSDPVDAKLSIELDGDDIFNETYYNVFEYAADEMTCLSSTLSSLNVLWSDILTIHNQNNGSGFPWIGFSLTAAANASIAIYGVELDITYDDSSSGTIGSGPFNKITYDGTTLIDLTSDTISANKVLEGVSFHLPSGSSATGTKGAPELHTATTTLSSNSRTISFSSLVKEPDWYIVVCNSTGSSISTPLAYFADGKGYYFTSTTSSQNISESNYTGSSSYSSGTLTLTSYNSSTYYFKAATYTLYYY